MRINCRILIAAVALVLSAFPPASARVVYVKSTATGANDGSSWAHAFTDLQSGLAAAVPSDEIWVAAGTYKPTFGSDRSATHQLLNGVALYGGFVGTEAIRAERDWVANVTILSGDIGVVVDNTDNSNHVVTGSGTNSTAVLDGFTVMNGNAAGGGGGGMFNDSGSPTIVNVTFSSNHGSNGGGMYNHIYSDPTLVNVAFSRNSAVVGGGMLNYASSPTLVNVTFSGNSATGGGGGMFNAAVSSPTLINVTFSGNYGDRGGGISNETSYPTLINTVLWGDSATSADDEIHNQPGGSTPTISHSLIHGCGGSGGEWDTSLGTDGGHNIDADPLFIDATNGNLHVWSSSSAIDAGDSAALPAGITVDLDGNPRVYGTNVDMGAYEYQSPPTGIDDGPGDSGPEATALRSVYPNPFNPSATITFSLAVDSEVELLVFDVTGALVKTLIEGHRASNTYRVAWDGLNNSGGPVASGVYFYRLVAGDFMATKKMVLIR